MLNSAIIRNRRSGTGRPFLGGEIGEILSGGGPKFVTKGGTVRLVWLPEKPNEHDKRHLIDNTPLL